MKISVLMPSFLGEYPNSASNKEAKFNRAVNSFLNQDYDGEKELLIISDGCERTTIESAKYAFHPNIKLIQIPKQELFSGVVRNTGLFYSTGEIVCYLDVDDFLNSGHLQAIANGFKYYPDADWVYFDDTVIYKFNPMKNDEILSKAKRDASLEMGCIGISNIAHKKLPEFTWHDCHNYNHDWTFVQKLIKKQPNPPKIDGCEYNVCHIPASADS